MAGDLAGRSPDEERAMFSVEVGALQMAVLSRNAPLCFFGCLVSGRMVDGSGSQGLHARHWKYARVQRRSWTLIYSLALFFFATLLKT